MTCTLLPLLLALHPSPSPTASPPCPPAPLVRVADVVPGIQLDIRYATEHNFTGVPLAGYPAADAWLLPAAAEALARVQASLAEEGLGLIVYDAYRPARASRAMVDWCEETDREDLLRDGYIAAASGHNHGHTVDLGLIQLETGLPLPMGSEFDTFDSSSHTANAEGEVRANRMRLAEAMQAEGFRPYRREWWHFRYPMSDTEPLDVPYGCQEPAAP